MEQEQGRGKSIESGVPQQTPEVAVEQPEVGREHQPVLSETPEQLSEAERLSGGDVSIPYTQSLSTMQVDKDALRMRVERTLENNLWKIYLSLPEGRRQQFKEGGELCAERLRLLLDEKRVKPRQALGPITRWLKLIPHVLWAFLYQEAKIKTDSFMALHKERQEESQHKNL